MKRRPLLALLAIASVAWATAARAEDGYDLWLRYRPMEGAAAVGGVTVLGDSPTLKAARAELERGLAGLRGPAPASTRAALLAGTSAQPRIAGLKLPLQAAGPQGYVIRSVQVDGRPTTVIAANSDVGVLYGAFHLL